MFTWGGLYKEPECDVLNMDPVQSEFVGIISEIRPVDVVPLPPSSPPILIRTTYGVHID